MSAIAAATCHSSMLEQVSTIVAAAGSDVAVLTARTGTDVVGVAVGAGSDTGATQPAG